MKHEMYETVACPMSSRHWRNSEGTIVGLGGGVLLLAYDQFYGPPYRWDIDDDFWNSRIMGKVSPDLGRSWGEDFLIQANDARINLLAPSLLRLTLGELLLFFRKSESLDPTLLVGWMKRSADGGRTWSAPTRLPDLLPGGMDAYTGGGWFLPDANDSAVQLSTGRILVPGGRVLRDLTDSTGVRWATKVNSCCFISDDGGLSWRRGKGEFSAPGRGSMEPHLAELAGGRLLAIMRTDQGRVYRTWSDDGGETWSRSEPIPEIVAPESCPHLGRIPGTEDLVLLYNHHFTPGADHGGRRNPLTTALSRDGGQTWGHIKNLVEREHGEWVDQQGRRHTWSWAMSDPSLTFVEGKMIVSFWDGVSRSPCHGVPCSLTIKAVDVGWLYAGRE